MLQKVYLCDAEFFLSHITRHINHLHAITQRFRDGFQYIGCGDKQHLKAHTHRHTIIMELPAVTPQSETPAMNVNRLFFLSNTLSVLEATAGEGNSLVLQKLS